MKIVFDHPYPNIVNQKISIIVVWIVEAVRFGRTCEVLKDILSILNKCYVFSKLNSFPNIFSCLLWQFIGLPFYNYPWYSSADMSLFNAFSIKITVSISVFMINDMEMAHPLCVLYLKEEDHCWD